MRPFCHHQRYRLTGMTLLDREQEHGPREIALLVSR